MSYEFKKLGEVESVSTLPVTANALVEIDGAVRRVPAGVLASAPLVILPETELTADPDAGVAPITAPLQAPVADGDTVSITYNGTAYECTGVNVEGMGVAFGNLAAVSEVYTGNPDAPFVVVLTTDGIDDNGDGVVEYGGVMPLDGATSVTLSIVEATSGGGNAGGGGVQPDWNQNDPNAADYVKNRTHYVESSMEIIPETSVSTEEGMLRFASPFVEGQEYSVVFDGVSYTCLAKYYDGYVMIGNNAIYEYDGDDTTDTGEPFAIECQSGIAAGTIFFPSDDTATHTICITCSGEVVHTIDPKFLPPALGYVEKDTIAMVHGDPAELQADYRHVLIENAPYPDFIANHNTCFVDVVTSGSITLQDGTKYSAAGAQTVETTWEQVFSPSYGDTWKTNIFIPLLVSTNGNSYVNIHEIVCHPGMTSLDAYFSRAIPTNFTGSITVEVTLRASNREMAAQSISMWSSTEGSTKRFRITVDDSGILTATEV